MRQITHWVDGEALALNGRSSEVQDPATGQVTARVLLADEAAVAKAVEVAATAFQSWREVPLSRRTTIMFALREAISANIDELAAIITSEHGRTLDDARGEIARGLENVEYACGLATHLNGVRGENVSTAIDSWSIREPLGVVAGITPFNFPAMVPLWMFPIAIAAGNTFVLKPSERDPGASMFLAELARSAGLPDGVLNVVNGDRTAVDALITHHDVAAVSFVGSTPVAQHVYETASLRHKRVQALGGAKNHMVVLPDADLDAAADAAVSAAYGSAGERCMAVSVVVAVGESGDPLVDRIAARARAVVVRPGTDPSSQMGPLITREHRDRVAGHVDGAAAAGAVLVVDGRSHDLPDGEGHWLGPSLLDHVAPTMECYRQEIFGPVLCVVRAESLAGAIELVNANPYGNGTAIFTRSGDAARQFQRRVDVGMVGVNVPIPVPTAHFSFGGFKASLFGPGGVYGPEGVRFYTRTKHVTSRWEPSVDHGFAFPTGADTT